MLPLQTPGLECAPAGGFAAGSTAASGCAPVVAGPVLPAQVQAALWRGTQLSAQVDAVVPSGWPGLDAQLPGAGWPCRSICELLTAQPGIVEWRLLCPALRPLVEGGAQVVVVGPPRPPYLPGLVQQGLDERRFVWIQAEGPAERLWATEQLIKADARQAVVAWLPQARPEQLRRLQVCAQAGAGPVFLCLPQAAQHEASAAPLRVHAGFGLDWELQVRILKRRGPAFDGTLHLPSVPAGLAPLLTPRLRRPSRLFQREVLPDVVGRPAVPAAPRRHAAAH